MLQVLIFLFDTFNFSSLTTPCIDCWSTINVGMKPKEAAFRERWCNSKYNV